MTKQELMTYLHQYTPWEMLHLTNQGKHLDIENYNKTLAYPIQDEGKNWGLHFPHTPDAKDTFSEKLFLNPQNPQIRIVQHDRYTPPVLHNHNFFELMYVYEGEFTQQISSARLLMHTGDFCLIPPNVYHSLDVCNYSIVLNVLISKDKFHDLIFNNLHGNNILSEFFIGNTYSANINDYIIFHTNGDPKIQDIILDMCLETINNEEYSVYLIHAHLILLLGLLLRNYEKSCELPTIKKKADTQNFGLLKYIETNYKDVTLPELAERFHYTPQTISQRIRQLTGLSFTEYLLQKRMQVASEMLSNTNLKIRVICEETGYHNPEHFIRTFRKYYGLSPSEYRNTHQNTFLRQRHK